MFIKGKGSSLSEGQNSLVGLYPIILLVISLDLLVKGNMLPFINFLPFFGRVIQVRPMFSGNYGCLPLVPIQVISLEPLFMSKPYVHLNFHTF